VNARSQKTLAIAPWMTAPAVVRLMQALHAGEVDVRFVGGAVRNAVMNLPVTEIDIATPETPDRVTERLRAAKIKAVPTGLDHGTVMAVVDGQTFEITTLRRDTACDGRHALVEFTTDWHEDARRRDFTINAMSLRPDGSLFDDHGGEADARAGLVRFVGDPADRIREDYLRILRLFRFFAWYGRKAPDAATLAAVRTEAEGLKQLSAERVQQELTKLLQAPAPLEAVTLMAETGVLTRILSDARDIETFRNFLGVEKEAGEGGDWLLRLAALLPDENAARRAAERLKLSNAERDRLLSLLRAEPRLGAGADALNVRRALYHFGADLVRDRALLAWARAGSEDPESWRALLRAAAEWTPRKLPVTGEDVLALGVPAGPKVGQLLAAATEWWIGAGFAPSRDELLSQLRQITSH